MTRASSQRAEDLLATLMAAHDDALAEEYLVLLTECAKPIIRHVINKTVFRFRGSFPQDQNVEDIQEAEDLVSQAHVCLVAKLLQLRSGGRDRPIKDFSSYVAGMSQNVCNNYLRQKWPERYRLKARTHYILSNDDRFAIWELEGGGRGCGLVEWKNRRVSSVSERRLRDLQNGHNGLASFSGAQGHDIAALLYTIFKQAGGPLEIGDVVKVAAGAMGIRDQLPGPLPRADGDFHSDGSSRLDGRALGTLEEGLRFEWMWNEIRQLPHTQRIALLLGLRDQHGDSLLAVLARDRVLSPARLAAALEMDSEDLLAIWKELPLDDGRIASILGVSRRAVSIYRLSARRRLTRTIGHESDPEKRA